MARLVCVMILLGFLLFFFPNQGGGYVQTLLDIDDGNDGDDVNIIEDNNLVELFVVFSPNEGEGLLRRC